MKGGTGSRETAVSRNREKGPQLLHGYIHAIFRIIDIDISFYRIFRTKWNGARARLPADSEKT
jgi:hypothetical protein